MARNMLDKAKSFVLMTVVQGAYTESGMNDVEFAEAFSRGQFVNVNPQVFPVTDGNICGARKALGIESNVNRGRGGEAAKIAAEIVIERLNSIEEKLDRLLVHFSAEAGRDL